MNHICHFKKKDYLGLLQKTCKSLNKAQELTRYTSCCGVSVIVNK